MSGISGGLRILIVLCIASSIILQLLDGSRFKDRIKLLCGVMLLTLILQLLSPLISELERLINIFPDGDISDTGTPNDTSDPSENVIKESARQMAVYIKSLVCGRFDITDEEINVSVLLEEKEGVINVSSVTVSVTKSNMIYAKDIADYISDLMGCVCTVIEF